MGGTEGNKVDNVAFEMFLCTYQPTVRRCRKETTRDETF